MEAAHGLPVRFECRRVVRVLDARACVPLCARWARVCARAGRPHLRRTASVALWLARSRTCPAATWHHDRESRAWRGVAWHGVAWQARSWPCFAQGE